MESRGSQGKAQGKRYEVNIKNGKLQDTLLIELRSKQAFREQCFHIGCLADRTLMRIMQRSGFRLTCGELLQPCPLELA